MRGKRIPELWIINLKTAEVEICRSPGTDGYRSITTAGRNDVLEPERLPGAQVRLADILG